MKKSKLADRQSAVGLQQMKNRNSVGDMCRKTGVGQDKFFRSKSVAA
jgi:hypothetical protein